MARVPAIMLASMLTGSSSLRRKSAAQSKVNETKPQGCEGHTQAAPAGWAVHCNNEAVDSYSSGLKMVGNYVTTYDYCWQMCREWKGGCDVFYFHDGGIIGTHCQFYEYVEDQGGLCFREDRIFPGGSSYVYYNADKLVPNQHQNECRKVNPGPSCEEHKAALGRPGWTVSCDQGIDYGLMSGATYDDTYSFSYLACLRECEDRSECLGVEVRIRESFPYSWSCGMLRDRSQYEPGQEQPLSMCSKAEPGFLSTKHHVLSLDKRSVLTNCSAAMN